MWHTILLSALAGLMGANAVPHFVKGMVGEPFPNVWGNDPLRNAVAGVLGLALAAGFGVWAGLPDHPVAGSVSGLAGALLMAVFHGRRGAFRLNSRLGLPTPPGPEPIA
ncbi:hypothetical protein ACFYTQ_20785 [Nocardia sp. NPDC004068]|uniref:hypothetical protein n=1 Tax=Nocardia sp. NPDC004068 TaxID=3364303 RepID=UPI0036A774FD